MIPFSPDEKTDAASWSSLHLHISLAIPELGFLQPRSLSPIFHMYLEGETPGKGEAEDKDLMRFWEEKEYNHENWPGLGFQLSLYPVTSIMPFNSWN